MLKIPDKIFLVGLPGSGKSTFGKSLAKALKKEFIDLDAEITTSEKKSIPEIFNKEGEEQFRIKEQQNLHLVVENSSQFLLATGGGAPCFFDNMEYMKSNGYVIFLNTNIEAIVTRVLSEKSTRPLIEKIDNEDMTLNLLELHKKRLPHYEKAHLVLDHDDINVEIALEKLYK